MKIKILLLISILSLFYSCDKEEEVTVELEKGKYYIEDNPNDPIQHYKYNLQKETGIVLITDPKIEDYRYNFLDINREFLVPPKQDEDIILAGIKFTEDILLNHYSIDFKKNYFPVTIQLADTVKWFGLVKYEIYNASVSTNFIAISHINEDLPTMSVALTKKIRGDVNASFWTKYIIGDRELINIPEEFFKVSDGHYNKYDLAAPNPKIMGDEAYLSYAYNIGFVGYDEQFLRNMGFILLPDEEMDVYNYFQLIFSKTQKELDEIFEKSDKVRQKYEIIKNTLIKNIGFDISKLNFKF